MNNILVFLQKWGLLIVIIILAIVSILVFKRCNGPNTDRVIDGYVQSDIYKHDIDSLTRIVDSLGRLIDYNYAEHASENVSTEIRYINRTKYIKDENYLSLDTMGRVSVFRHWITDSTGAHTQ